MVLSQTFFFGQFKLITFPQHRGQDIQASHQQPVLQELRAPSSPRGVFPKTSKHSMLFLINSAARSSPASSAHNQLSYGSMYLHILHGEPLTPRLWRSKPPGATASSLCPFLGTRGVFQQHSRKKEKVYWAATSSSVSLGSWITSRACELL